MLSINLTSTQPATLSGSTQKENMSSRWAAMFSLTFYFSPLTQRFNAVSSLQWPLQSDGWTTARRTRLQIVVSQWRVIKSQHKSQNSLFRTENNPLKMCVMEMNKHRIMICAISFNIYQYNHYILIFYILWLPNIWKLVLPWFKNDNNLLIDGDFIENE